MDGISTEQSHDFHRAAASFYRQSHQRFAQVGRPVGPAEIHQHVRCREGDVVGHRLDRQAETHVPEVARSTGVASRDVAFALDVRDQLPEPGLTALGPGGFKEIDERLPDRVIERLVGPELVLDPLGSRRFIDIAFMLVTIV